MIGEAVNELKGDGPAEKPEVRVELPVNAHIPHDYVPGERLRLEAYTRIAAIDSEADITAVHEELTDRFGDSRQVRVQRLYPKTLLKPAVRTMLVPTPKTASIGGQPLRDTELLTWCGEIIRSVLADLPPVVT
jgi:transcription-repair coupling factor (superfamily II helicase)